MDSYYANRQLPQPVLPALPQIELLKGQTALVTGANSGIGRAIALAFGRAGADVIVNYVSEPEEAERVAEEIRSNTGRRALAVHADVSDEAGVSAMFATAIREFGTVDVLVSNAGIQRDAPFHEMTVAQWDQVMNVNLRGAFLCAREAVREFLRRGVRPDISVASGKIIFISSVHDVIPWAGHVNYAASKGGLTLLMKSLAQEVAEQRIRVNSISPGAIRTPINTGAWDTQQAYTDLMKLIPYKRIGEAAEIGRAAVWLASDFTDYLVGSTIYIDGGMTLYPGFETGG
jgi:glucose 1-dehydrogenase